MANICKLSFKRRYPEAVKDAGQDRSRNMAMQRAREFHDLPSWVGSCYGHAAGEQREPKPILSFERNVVSPYASRKGKPSASRAYRRAGKGWGESECRALMAWIGVATSLHAKAGRLPQVTHHEIV